MEILIAREIKAKAIKPMAESSYIIKLYNPKSIATSFALLNKKVVMPCDKLLALLGY